MTRTRRVAAVLILALSLPACDSGETPTLDLGAADRGGGFDAWTDAPPADAPAETQQTDAPLPSDALPPADAPPPPDGPTPDHGACGPPIVPKASPDPWSVRLPSAGFGGLLTKKTGAYTDVFLKSPTDYTRIGARLDWGGTVVFFGLTADPGSNVIDANDTGRELQIALYDPTRARQPCAHNASCLGSSASCGNEITYLGWNPVQGGDECNHGAKVISSGKQGDALQLVVQPVQWNPDWDAPDCRKSACPASGIPVAVTYTFELRYVSKHVVEVMTEVTSNETFSHPSTGQEWPTLYVSHGKGGPDLPLLLDAGGKTITLSTPANNGFFVGSFTSPGPWASWQNSAKSYGVGLAMDQGITAFQGWRGDGVTAPYFHNVRAVITFGLASKKTVRGLSYLALGGYGTVKAELQAALKKRPPFGSLDAPAGSTVSYTPGKPVATHGWALDTAAVQSVTATIDGKLVATYAPTAARPDVCEVYPGYAGCPKVGFSGTIPTAGLSACPHLLRVSAKDTDGNVTVLGERRLVAKP